MASARSLLTPVAVVLLALFAWQSAGEPASPPRPLQADTRDGWPSSSPILLPLVFSTPNSSRDRPHERSLYLRHELSKAGNNVTAAARMRLHDDLFTNGYYSTMIYIGTPPQEFALIVDTGSTVTYVPCDTCKHCGPRHQDPRFQTSLSSSYQPIECNIDCNCDKEKNQCTYNREYAEMSSSSGVLGEDIISFGNESSLEPQRAVFGCENWETGDIYTQKADGIMGLGRGPLSLMDQLVNKHVISDSFSLCYGGMDAGGGTMVLGAIPSPLGMIFSHSDPYRSAFYNLELKDIHISGKALQLNPSVFDERHGTILDSGTTYAYLPAAAFSVFKDAIMKELHSVKQISGTDAKYDDICFAGAGSDVSQLSKTFPEVSMVFSNGQELSLSPENYLFRHAKVHGAYCLGIFQGKDSTTLLGGIIVRNTLVTYDRKNDRIGFWKTNCSDLWEQLHVYQASPPSHSAVLDGKNSSTGKPLILSSDPSQGQSQVSLIVVDIHLSINYSELLPHITELSELIAHELELNAAQVWMMSSKIEGNGSFVRWAISPPKYSYFISNSTTMTIISRLTEHRIKLPEMFGRYQLVEWKVEPLSKRNRWEWHSLILFFAVLVAVAISSSIFLVWYLYRHRQINAYRPVDATLADQELQTL